MSSHATYTRTFAALLGLLFLTVGAWYLDFGRAAILVSMAIAAAKAALVVLYFMHVRESDRIIWVYAGAGAAWLAIAFVLSMADYLTRSVLTLPRG